jgi:hypothetical protein
VLEATGDFFDRINREPGGARSIIGAHST